MKAGRQAGSNLWAVPFLALEMVGGEGKGQEYIVGERLRQAGEFQALLTCHGPRAHPPTDATPLETARATVGPADCAALQALRDQLGRRFRAGLVLCLGDQVVPSGDRLWLVALPALWAE